MDETVSVSAECDMAGVPRTRSSVSAGWWDSEEDIREVTFLKVRDLCAFFYYLKASAFRLVYAPGHSIRRRIDAGRSLESDGHLPELLLH